jgi:hypothetical protein
MTVLFQSINSVFLTINQRIVLSAMSFQSNEQDLHILYGTCTELERSHLLAHDGARQRESPVACATARSAS